MDRIIELFYNALIQGIEKGRQMREAEWARCKAHLEMRRQSIVNEMRGLIADIEQPPAADGSAGPVPRVTELLSENSDGESDS